MANSEAFSQILNQVESLQKNIAKEVAPEINKLFKESVAHSLVDYYNSYDPFWYTRTNNFIGVYKSAKTTANGNIVTMSVSDEYMHDYPGFWGKPLYSSAALDFFFKNGEHGHGKWMVKQSLPPAMYVERDIEDGFGDRIQKIINDKVKKLLK